eukprot:TRINITY_DN317_c0_g1_i3.p1 TRINITY_DN317_c0_g1~~TRINITY_DN317_c0_g1_i3.p1  ORF type:complete len:120 (+),score=49.37 TRINITY_DN317_c0_g1_i3:239-598(+)
MAILSRIMQMAAFAGLVTSSQSLMTPSATQMQPEVSMEPGQVWNNVMGENTDWKAQYEHNEIKLQQEDDKDEEDEKSSHKKKSKKKSSHKKKSHKKKSHKKKSHKDDDDDEEGEEEEEE